VLLLQNACAQVCSSHKLSESQTMRSRLQTLMTTTLSRGLWWWSRGLPAGSCSMVRR